MSGTNKIAEVRLRLKNPTIIFDKLFFTFAAQIKKPKRMTAVFHGIGTFFESIFPAVEAIGASSNILFSIIMTIANFIWMWYLVKNKDKYQTNRMEDLPK